MRIRNPLPRAGSMRLLRVSAVLTLGAIALMAWALIDPTPLPVMLAMTGGQILGTTALALYVYVIVRDLRRDRSRASRDSLTSIRPPIDRERHDSLSGMPPKDKP